MKAILCLLLLFSLPCFAKSKEYRLVHNGSETITVFECTNEDITKTHWTQYKHAKAKKVIKEIDDKHLAKNNEYDEIKKKADDEPEE